MDERGTKMINKMPKAEKPVETTSMVQEGQGLTPTQWKAVTDRLAELNERMIEASPSSPSPLHDANGSHVPCKSA